MTTSGEVVGITLGKKAKASHNDDELDVGKKITFIDEASHKKKTDVLSQVAGEGQGQKGYNDCFYQAYQAMKMFFATPGLGKSKEKMY